MEVTVPQLFTVVLPVLVTPLVGWLNQPRMPQWLRCFIAAVVIIAVSVLCAVYLHAFTSNVVEDFLITAAWCSVLCTGLLEPLYKLALAEIPGPFAAFFKQRDVSTPPTVKDFTRQ
jgi:predicted PurR-regulated permease PerM